MKDTEPPTLASSQRKREGARHHHFPFQFFGQSEKLQALGAPNQICLPLNRCVATGLHADIVIVQCLRNPWNPFSWWNKGPRVRVGLSESCFRSHRHRQTLSKICGVLAIAAVLVPILFSFPFSHFLGLAVCLLILSGVLQAAGPLRGSHRKLEKVKGLSSAYRRSVRQERI